MRKAVRKTATKEAETVEPAFAPIVAAFAGDRNVSQRRMFGSSSVLSVKGRIFVMMVKGEFVAKLPKTRVDELVKGGKGHHFDPGHRRLMKEWIAIAGQRAAWRRLAREAYEYVKG